MQKHIEIEKFWQSYLSTLPRDQCSNDETLPEAWGFGDGPDMADELGLLVYEDIKTATCSLLWEYEAEGEKTPQVGDLSIILDGQANPLCIIETIEVAIKPFNMVDARFAYDEGEGDRTLAYWRAGHWHYFTPLCQKINRQPSESMPLVCERFRVIYKAPKVESPDKFE